MSIHRIGKRRLGRPLLGAEPLDRRFTMMITASMEAKLASKSNSSAFARTALARALGLGGLRRKTGRKIGRGVKRVRRYKK